MSNKTIKIQYDYNSLNKLEKEFRSCLKLIFESLSAFFGKKKFILLRNRKIAIFGDFKKFNSNF